MHVVVGGFGLHPQMRRLRRIDFRMLPAPVVKRDDTAVVGAPLVRANAEHPVEITFERYEEPACRAQSAGRRFRGQRLGAVRTFIPAFCGLVSSQRAEYVTAGQHEFLDAVLKVLCGSHRCVLGVVRRIPSLYGYIVFGLCPPIFTLLLGLCLISIGCRRSRGRLSTTETVLEPGIVRLGPNRIGHRQVGGQQTVFPRHPCRRHQGLIRRHERGFVDRPLVDIGVVIQRHRPFPAFVSPFLGFETEIRNMIVLVD